MPVKYCDHCGHPYVVGLLNWIKLHIFFVGWSKHWKGVYVHCISKTYCYRFYWTDGSFRTDRHRKHSSQRKLYEL